MKQRLILIPGWAHIPSDLGELRELLETRFEVESHSLPTLYAAGSTHEASYAHGLCEILSSGPVPALIMGWSMGGMVGIETARIAPESVCGLILVNATARFCRENGYACGTPPANLLALSRQLKSDPAGMLGGFYELAASPADTVARALSDRARPSPPWAQEELKRGLDYLKEMDLRNELTHIAQPCCILHGQADRVIPSGASELLVSQLSRSRIATLDGVGHDLPLRNPQWVFSEVTAWDTKQIKAE